MTIDNITTIDASLDKKIDDFRDKIIIAEESMLKADGALKDKEIEQLCPLVHSYGDGCYIRQIFMPKGTLITSKIHKVTHPYFVMTGKASVATENGVEIIQAPYQGITRAGTKRALYIHEDMIWITVHVTNETDLDKIEEEIIAKDFEEYDQTLIDELNNSLEIGE
ncbi:hypothetical protein KAR91_09960 [Candidatus Pacearchaeota archaeon]|nr:hypothetical protein [Candidatus Pacearchaeota archaeon]